jgi:hypothetical protein
VNVMRRVRTTFATWSEARAAGGRTDGRAGRQQEDAATRVDPGCWRDDGR